MVSKNNVYCFIIFTQLTLRFDHFGIAGFLWSTKLAWIKSSSINRDPNLDATLIIGANVVCIISVMLQVIFFTDDMG